MQILENTYYIGVNDFETDLFEGQYLIPDGISYNSYVIMDEKVAVLDTVAISFTEEWLEKLARVLNGKTVDYLIIHHMEPDHSANIANFIKAYPNTTLVATAKAFQFMEQFFGKDFDGGQVDEISGRSVSDGDLVSAGGRLVVADGDTLYLGKHTLHFYTAPMVHWPEVMVSYDSATKALFSADAFGTFGVPRKHLVFDEHIDMEEKEMWVTEARKYYIGIVGKYGLQVQALLKKLSVLDVAAICPLHGPILASDLAYYISLYNTWSSYIPEEEGIVIAYSSIYGNTALAAETLCQKLTSLGAKNVIVYDLARADFSTVVADAFRYSKLVLASATYNAGLFPAMQHFIDYLKERNFQNRAVAFIENGSWTPIAAKLMKEELSSCKNLVFCENLVTIHSAVNEECEKCLDMLVWELVK